MLHLKSLFSFGLVFISLSNSVQKFLSPIFFFSSIVGLLLFLTIISLSSMYRPVLFLFIVSHSFVKIYQCLVYLPLLLLLVFH